MQRDMLIQALFLHLALRAAQESTATEGEQGDPHPDSVSERAENCIVQSVQYSGSVCFQQPLTFIAFIGPSFVKKIPTLITSHTSHFFFFFFFTSNALDCMLSPHFSLWVQSPAGFYGFCIVTKASRI